MNNIRSAKIEKRSTRSYLLCVEDQKFFEMNYIDNFYCKKKKKIFNSKLNNEPLSPTKIKFPMALITGEAFDDTCITKIEDPKEKLQEEALPENCGDDQRHPETNIMTDTKKISKSSKPTKKAKKQNKKVAKQFADENIQLSTSSEQKKEPMHDSKIKEKSPKLFSVETDLKENDQKLPKKVSKRYKELLENSLLIFDRPERKYLVSEKKTSKKIQEKEKNVESNHEENSNLTVKEDKNSKTKEKKKKFKKEVAKPLSKSDFLLTKENRFYKLTEFIGLSNSEKELLHMYNEVREFKFLGKKRSLPISLPESSQNNSLLNFEETLNLKNFPEIKFINYKKYTNDEKNTLKQILKNNFINSEIEENLKKTVSVLKTAEGLPTPLSSNIPNPFDATLRRDYANTLGFIQTFQEDYAPIQMQKDNEKIFEKFENSDTLSVISSNSTISNSSNISSSKSHFIKKKQSAVNIKRQCGVSYVVPTESKQTEVSDVYKPLGHLVYQGTYSINQIQDSNIVEYIDNLIIEELMNKPLLITTFESPEEVEMKDYLLYPEKRLSIAKEIFIVESLDDVWKFTKDKFFLAVNLVFDKTRGVRNFNEEEIKSFPRNELLLKSNVQIGILFRKATSGIKSVLKLYKSGGLNKNEHSSTFKLCNFNPEENLDTLSERLSGSNMYTLSMRIELFVPQLEWKECNQFTKQFLYTFMCQVEEKIAKLILNWNENRSLMHSLTKDNGVREYIHTLPFYTLTAANDSLKCDNLLGKNEFNLDCLYFENKGLVSTSPEEKKVDLRQSQLLQTGLVQIHNSFADKISLISNLQFSNSPLPMYIISTRNCFVFDLNVVAEEITHEGRTFIRKEYFFEESNLPSNYHKFRAYKDDLRVGIVTYENYFTHQELKEIERKIEQTEEFSLKDAFLPETAQKTFAGEKLKRTKFFFGSRYMWTKKQLAEPNSYVGAGIRKDVSPPPYWMKEKIEYPLVNAGIILKDFVNSFALNVYHDGSEGLGQHFDDAVRFKQPIYTLRLFSDCRLSFGSQLYGFCNGAFTIPLPRGCICIMEENSYASNGVKHCIRPCDMTGKSSALIMRQMHPIMINEAEKYDLLVDFPSWMSSLSVNEKAVTYSQQKANESEFFIKLSELEKKNNRHNEMNVDEEIVDTMQDLLNSVELYTFKHSKQFVAPNTKKRGKRNDY